MDDGGDSMVETIAKQGNMGEEEVWEFISSFVGHANFVTLQFDTGDKSCRVLRIDEEGVNEWTPEREVVAKIDGARFSTDTADLQRQLDEAVATLTAETNKDTEYARNLLRFIMDVREELKGHKTAEEWGECEEDDEVDFNDEDEF